MEKLDDLTPLTKDELERRELSYKVQQLSTRWWQKPSFWLGGVPALLAVLTFGQLIFTNYFGLQRDLIKKEKLYLQSETSYLKRDRKLLEDRKEQLSVETNQLSQQKTQLEEDKKELQQEKTTLNNDLRQLRGENSDLKKSNLALKQETTRLEADLGEVRKELVAQQERLRTEPIRVLLAAVAESDANNQNAHHDSVKDLIDLVAAYAERHNTVDEVVAMFDEHRENPVLHSVLLYILYKATNDTDWREQLLAIAEKDGARLSPDFWLVLGTADWDEQYVEVWRRLIPVVRDSQLSPNAMGAFLLNFNVSIDMTELRKDPLFFDIVVLARDYALRSTAGPELRIRSVTALTTLSPDAAIVVQASLLSNSDAPSELRRQVASELGRLEQYDSDEFGEARIKHAFPSSDSPPDAFAKWLEKNQSLVDNWLEDDLQTLRDKQ